MSLIFCFVLPKHEMSNGERESHDMIAVGIVQVIRNKLVHAQRTVTKMRLRIKNGKLVVTRNNRPRP